MVEREKKIHIQKMPLHYSSFTSFYSTLPVQVFFFHYAAFLTSLFLKKKNNSGMQFRDKQTANK